MNKFKKLLLLLIGALLMGGIVCVIYKGSLPKIPSLGTNVDSYANLKIESAGNTQSFDVSGFVGKTALEATQAKVNVVASGEGQNAFITSINGVAADSKKHEFWEFDVNGAQAQVGVGSYIIKNHDEIEWKISNY